MLKTVQWNVITIIIIIIIIIIIVFIIIVDDYTYLLIHFKFITKCDKCYYKVRQVLLQSTTIITKCDRTPLTRFECRRPHLDRKTRFEGYVHTIQNSSCTDTIAERIR